MTARRRPGALLAALAPAMLALVLAGCGSSAHGTSSSSAQSPAQIESRERNEEAAALKNEESTEDQRNREYLSILEAKNREEAAETNAKHTEALAAKRAKKREEEAKKAVKKREEEAKKKAASTHSSGSSKTTTTKQAPTPSRTKSKPKSSKPKGSLSAPPTVGAPNGPE